MLRLWLEAHDKTASDLARDIGRPVRTVQGWVAGRRLPRVDAAAEIEEATSGAVRCVDWR